jgi:uncharacterized membrane protein
MSDPESPNKRPLPDAWNKNPFEAPAAHVEDARSSLDGTLAANPNKLDAGRGLAWWSESWRLFQEATGLWVGIGVVLMLINFGLALIPFVGSVVNTLIFPVLNAGLALGCRSLDAGEELTFDHLFAGFQNHLGRLLAVGALYLGGMFVIVFVLGGVTAAFIGVSVATTDVNALADAGSPLVIIILLSVLLGASLVIPLMMAVWFAPALVVLHDMAPLEAMKLSFRGCLRNILPFLVYGLVSIALGILATLPLLLGWLVLLPVIFCSVYIAYRDIFIGKR